MAKCLTVRAKRPFYIQLPGPKGVHLFGNPDWSFLLDLDLEILSMDALAWDEILTRYTGELRRFLDEGGIVSWGITPTLDEEVAGATAAAMTQRLDVMWDFLAAFHYQILGLTVRSKVD